jgi:hypothetical protein
MESAIKKFENDANRDSKASYPAVKFGGFEWREGWFFFENPRGMR